MERIVSPCDIKRAQQVLVEIARQSAGNAIVGKTRLFKTFYFAHLFYATSSPGYLTEWPIVRMPNGPGIDRFDLLLSGLVDEGAIRCESTRIGPYPTTRYLAVGEVKDRRPLSPEEVRAISDAVAFTAEKPAEGLSELTHEFSRSWNASDKMGEELNIYQDLLDDEAYTELEERVTQVSDEVDNLFGS